MVLNLCTNPNGCTFYYACVVKNETSNSEHFSICRDNSHNSDLFTLM